MSLAQYSEDCLECQPVLLNPQTLKPLPDDSPPMIAINILWKGIPKEQKVAFHKFTCQNSRDPEVMELVAEVHKQMTEALLSIV